MIEQVRLKCFRKHEDLTVNFVPGLNVIRGPNEAGKTTITEAILYAVYGAQALRNPISEVVTWDHKENELSATVTLKVSGVSYTFTRSPRGAECNYAGGKVTGQKEVSAFAANLLGADVKTSAVLMMASQAGLRGALEAGATGVSTLMGKLADFDVIDRILYSATKRLQLGSEEPVRAKLQAAKDEVQAAHTSMPNPEALQAAEIELQGLVLQAEEADARGTATLQPACVQAQQDRDDARARMASRSAGLQQLQALQRRLVDEQAKLGLARAESQVPVDAARAAQLRAELQDMQTAQARVDAYRHYQAAPAYPTVAWDQDQASFEAELKSVTTRKQDLQSSLTALVTEARVIASGRITNGRCPTCGSVKIDDEHVATKNAEVDAALLVNAKAQAELGPKIQEVSETLIALNSVEASARRQAQHFAKIAQYVMMDLSTYPPKVTWDGEVPQQLDPRQRQAELRELEAAATRVSQAAGRAQAHEAAIKGLEGDITVLQAHVDTIPEIDLDPLDQAYDAAFKAYMDNGNIVRELRNRATAARDTVTELKRLMETAADRLSAAEKRVAEYEEDVVVLAFNNDLVKRVRELKPVITDHLWNSVLASVSSFFSSMRGEASLVTKDDTGFRVNGRSVDSLSGSTLDVLALAIRVALSKTFVPHVSFMLLDEPAHGCDESRTSNLLGFMSSAGFDQTLLASHDELSESVASNVVMLGE